MKHILESCLKVQLPSTAWLIVVFWVVSTVYDEWVIILINSYISTFVSVVCMYGITSQQCKLGGELVHFH